MSANSIILTAYLAFAGVVLVLALAPVNRAPFRLANRAVTDIWLSIKRITGVDALNRRLNRRRAFNFIHLAERLESAGLRDSAERCRDTAARLTAGG